MTTRKKISDSEKLFNHRQACDLLDDVVCAWYSRDNTALEDAVHRIVDYRDGVMLRIRSKTPIPTLDNAVGLPFKERVKQKIKQYRLDFFDF